MPKIYHYTKLSAALEFILPTMSLRTNFLNKMNGPKENQKWHFGGIDIDYEGMYPETYTAETHIDHQYKLGEEIKSRVQALCFVHSNTFKGFDNEMMWAQYSENHAGICLELDEELFVEENNHLDIFKFENINYDLKNNVSLVWGPNLSKDENINNIIKRHFNLLFLSKSHYWDKEYEKRLLIVNDGFCKFNIAESLTGIYYGLKTNPCYDIAIAQFIDKEKTKEYSVYYENNRLKRMEMNSKQKINTTNN